MGHLGNFDILILKLQEESEFFSNSKEQVNKDLFLEN